MKYPCILLKMSLMVGVLVCLVGKLKAQSSYTSTNGTFTYTITNGSITITSFDYYGYTGPFGSGSVANIPSTINTLPVTRIGDGKNIIFIDLIAPSMVIIPNSVTNIEDYAFSLNEQLTTVIIGTNVTSIGENAFNWCQNLTNMNIPKSVTKIGSFAFSGCPIPSVTIPNSVISIGDQVFYSCSSLTNVNLGRGVISIGDQVFVQCSSLAAINVDPSNLVYSSVAGVLFDKSQQTLLVYPGGIAGSYSIPGGVTTIADRAFDGCKKLTGVNITNSVISIGYESFFDCLSLTSVSIPNSVTEIDYAAFVGCQNLTEFDVDPSNPVFSSLAGVLFDQSQTTILLYPPGLYGGYTIPDGIASIGDNAFAFCSDLTGVTIPNSVTNIGYAAFKSTGLISVTLPNSVSTTGDEAFEGCYSLTSVIIPDSVTTIGFASFSGSGLTSVAIPNSVTTIGDYAFEFCSGLTSVTIPSSVTSIGELAFDNPSFDNLTSIYFQGDAPTNDSTAFYDDFNATVYYLPGTAGSDRRMEEFRQSYGVFQPR